MVGKSASNPTSPVVQPRRAVSSPEELAVQDAIDAGFLVDDGGLLGNVDGGSGGGGGHYSTVSAIATAPRLHRAGQAPRSTPHVHSVFAHAPDGYGQQHACENLYSQVSQRTARLVHESAYRMLSATLFTLVIDNPNTPKICGYTTL